MTLTRQIALTISLAAMGAAGTALASLPDVRFPRSTTPILTAAGTPVSQTISSGTLKDEDGFVLTGKLPVEFTLKPTAKNSYLINGTAVAPGATIKFVHDFSASSGRLQMKASVAGAGTISTDDYGVKIYVPGLVIWEAAWGTGTYSGAIIDDNTIDIYKSDSLTLNRARISSEGSVLSSSKYNAVANGGRVTAVSVRGNPIIWEYNSSTRVQAFTEIATSGAVERSTQIGSVLPYAMHFDPTANAIYTRVDNVNTAWVAPHTGGTPSFAGGSRNMTGLGNPFGALSSVAEIAIINTAGAPTTSGRLWIKTGGGYTERDFFWSGVTRQSIARGFTSTSTGMLFVPIQDGHLAAYQPSGGAAPLLYAFPTEVGNITSYTEIASEGFFGTSNGYLIRHALGAATFTRSNSALCSSDLRVNVGGASPKRLVAACSNHIKLVNLEANSKFSPISVTTRTASYADAGTPISPHSSTSGPLDPAKYKTITQTTGPIPVPGLSVTLK